MAASLSLVDLPEGAVLQRAAGTSARDVPVRFTHRGAVGQGAPGGSSGGVQARVVRAGIAAAVVVDWSPLTKVVLRGGAGSGLLPNVPQGDGYRLELRHGEDAASVSRGTSAWGVGVNVLFQGQSNMLSTLAGGWSGYVVPGTGLYEQDLYPRRGKAFRVFDGAGWHEPSNARGAVNTLTNCIFGFGRLLTEALARQHGAVVPVGLIPFAQNAVSIDAMLPPKGPVYTGMFAADGDGTRGGPAGLESDIYGGDFEMAFYHQGEADVGRPTAEYMERLKALYRLYLGHTARFGRDAATLPFGVAVVGNLDPEVGLGVETIRTAQIGFVNWAKANGWPRVDLGWSTVDLPRADPYHFGGDEVQRRSMRRMLLTARRFLGVSPHGGRGPRAAGATIRGDVIDVAVQHGGGTGLRLADPARPPTGFYLSEDGFTTVRYLRPRSVALAGPSVVRITLASVPAGAVSVHYQNAAPRSPEACNPDIGNPVYDDTVVPEDGLGLPLQPTPAPLVARRAT